MRPSFVTLNSGGTVNLCHCQTLLYKVGNMSTSPYQRPNWKVVGLPPMETTRGCSLTGREQMDRIATNLKSMSSWLEWHIHLTTDTDQRGAVLFKSAWQGVYFVCDEISHDVKGTLFCLLHLSHLQDTFSPLTPNTGICFSQVSVRGGIERTTRMQLVQKKRQLLCLS